MEAQRVGQIEWLKGSRTGRTILARLGMETVADPQSLGKQEEREALACTPLNHLRSKNTRPVAALVEADRDAPFNVPNNLLLSQLCGRHHLERPKQRVRSHNPRVVRTIGSSSFHPRVSLSAACNVDVAGRFDCHPEPGINRVRCERRGCCFRNDSGQGGTTPTCYFPTGFSGYKVTHISDSPSGVTMTRMRRVRPSGLPEDAAEIDVEATFPSDTTARLTVTSANDPYRTEVPPVPAMREAASSMLAVFTTKLGDVVVYRTSDRQILFETDLSRLVYTPRFVQLVTLVPTTSLYGLGERKGRLLRDISTPHVGFNRDLLAVYLDIVGRPAMPPFWALGLHALVRRVATNSPEADVYEGVLNGSSQVLVTLVPTTSLYGLGERKGRLLRDISTPHVGFNRDLLAVDVAWMPIDVEKDTCEHGLFKEMSYRQPAVRVMHTLGPTLSIHPSATPVCRFAEHEAGHLGLLLTDQKREVPLQAEVLAPGITSYVLDFSGPRYDVYLSKVLKFTPRRAPLDGFWLDRNEPTLATVEPPGGCVMDGWDEVPYLPAMLRTSEAPLNRNTLCMSQQLGAGPHFVAHNAIPYQQAKAAHDVMGKLFRKRPLIVSRSSYSGIGKYAGHVIHGLQPTWQDLLLSVPMLLTASLLGMPLSGAEICGEGFDRSLPIDEELCATWFSLAMFYPLVKTNKPEIYQSASSSFSSAFHSEMIDMVKIRLALRPYLYYLFHRSHVAGETVARPLFVEFPNDSEAARIDNQFLWGSALMIVPILKPNVTQWLAYVPEGVWYDFETCAAIDSSRLPRGPSKMSGGFRELRRGRHRVLLLLRGGNIVPLSATSPRRLRDGEVLNYTLLVMLDEQSQARGSIFCDDGVSLGTYETGAYGLADITFVKDTMLVSPRHAGFACGVVREVRFMGLSPEPILRASLNDLPVTLTTQNNQAIITGISMYLNETGIMVLHWKERDENSTKSSLHISG
ncbi:lysosomal alpha-glucosidase-like [Haemaphysalis longicornis]